MKIIKEITLLWSLVELWNILGMIFCHYIVEYSIFNCYSDIVLGGYF